MATGRRKRDPVTEAGSGGAGRKPPVKPSKPKGQGERYAIMRRSKTNAEKAKGSGNTLREKIAKIEADKSLGRAEKDRMIKSVRQRHSKSAAEG